MVYARIAGGLANQIYQYMGAYSLAKKTGQKLILDISMCANGFTRGFLLNCFPRIKYDGLIKNTLKCSASVIDNIDSIKDQFAHGKCILLADKGSGQKAGSSSFHIQEYHGPDKITDEVAEDYYLCGNWLDEVYWRDCIGDLREIFFAPDGMDAFLDDFKKKDLQNTVGIHIRRGDFVYGGLTENDDDDYFRAAVEYIGSISDSFEFCVFSDDMDHAVSVLGTENKKISYIHSMDGLYGDVVDFCCLSLCRIKVISGKSTFSKLAFDLDPSANRKYLVKNREDTGLKHLIRNRAAWIFDSFTCININKNEILHHARRYPGPSAGKTRSAEEENEDMLKKCRELYERGEYEKAEQIAHRLWMRNDQSEAFHMLYGNILSGLGRSNEAAIEYSRTDINLHDVRDDIKKMTAAYKKTGRLSFFIIPDRTVHGVSSIKGMVLTGVILRRLGHRVVFLFRHDEYYEQYLKKGNMLTDQDGTQYGCEVISINGQDRDGLKKIIETKADPGCRNILIGTEEIITDKTDHYLMSEKDFIFDPDITEVKDYGMKDVFLIDDIYFEKIDGIMSAVMK